jgi:hypothetical protein
VLASIARLQSGPRLLHFKSWSRLLDPKKLALIDSEKLAGSFKAGQTMKSWLIARLKKKAGQDC